MEKLSEKKKRGRPPMLDEGARAAMRALYPELKSRRGLVNARYGAHALGLVKDREDCRWLVDGDVGVFRKTLLQELGRIRNPDDTVTVARRICELKPRAKDGVVMIRQWRRGGAKPGSALELTLRTTAMIDDYLRAHPDTTWQQVKMALVNAMDAVEATEAEDE